MSGERVLVVAVEDIATAGVVAAAAAHTAMEREAGRVIFVHVLDSHTLATGLFGMTGALMPVVESEDEGHAVLALAEAAFRAEYVALERPSPAMDQQLIRGNPGSVIPEVVRSSGADGIVVGARRPHAFGRLTHPDVRSALVSHLEVPVFVAALQSDPPESAGTSNR